MNILTMDEPRPLAFFAQSILTDYRELLVAITATNVRVIG